MRLALISSVFLIACCLPICPAHNIKIVRDKLLSLLFSLLSLLLFGASLETRILKLLSKVDFGILNSLVLSKVISIIIPITGMILTFALIFTIIRSLFKFYEEEAEADIRAVIKDRLLGALDGLFTVVGYIVDLTKYVFSRHIQLKMFLAFAQKSLTFSSIDSIKFVANLN